MVKKFILFYFEPNCAFTNEFKLKYAEIAYLKSLNIGPVISYIIKYLEYMFKKGSNSR